MAFWNKNQTRAEKRSVTTGLANPQGWLLESWGDLPSSSGKRVTAEKALGIAPVWSAVTLISEQIGQLPFKVYQSVGDDGERKEARGHRAWVMLHDKPNEHTPADRFWSTVSMHLLLHGNAFLLKHRTSASGMVDQLSVLDPRRMLVYWDGDQLIKSYVYTPANGDTRMYLPTDLVHLYGPSSDGIVGDSVVTRCRNALGTALSRDEFEGKFYERGANVSGVLQHPDRLSPEATRNLRESFANLYGGSANAHGTPVLEEGMEFKLIGSSMKDLELVTAQQLTRTDIAVMFKLPPNYLGGSSGDSLTYATVESNQIQFAQHAISPWTNVIASALSQDPEIFPQTSYMAEFALEGMLRADAAARSSFYEKMSGIGAMTVNEIRKLENLPPIEGGDEPRLPGTERISVADPAPQATEAPTEQNPLPQGSQPPALPPGRRPLTPVPAPARATRS
jgi:HK97 family phage portal protein